MHFMISFKSAILELGPQTSAQMKVGKISATNTLRPMQTTESPPVPPVVDKDLVRARGKKEAVLEKIRETGRSGLKSLGMMQDTPEAREAWALGEAWRNAQTYP